MLFLINQIPLNFFICSLRLQQPFVNFHFFSFVLNENGAFFKLDFVSRRVVIQHPKTVEVFQLQKEAILFFYEVCVYKKNLKNLIFLLSLLRDTFDVLRIKRNLNLFFQIRKLNKMRLLI